MQRKTYVSKSGIEFHLIRSNRKSLALELTPEGVLIVRSPQYVPLSGIMQFADEKKDWIEAHRKLLEERRKQTKDQPQQEKLSMAEIQKLADKALDYIPKRVAYYAPLVGVTYGRITIRNQKTRWGSCSSKGNLNFNCLLMLAPPEVIDSVVVHELCHRKEMNHSRRFYEEVYRVYPDYDRWNNWLKEHGRELLGRMV